MSTSIPSSPSAVGQPTAATRFRHAWPAVGRATLGIDDRDAVVVYDDLKSLSAGRAWWLLRASGIANVRILDGATAHGPAPGSRSRQATLFRNPVTSSSKRAGCPPSRSDEAGEYPRTASFSMPAPATDTVVNGAFDPRAGHIPGAINRPTTENVGPDGRFLPAAELRENFAALGITGDTPVAVYCGSGVTASHEIAALAIAGIPARLYPGSWSQWSNHPDRPVATGERG